MANIQKTFNEEIRRLAKKEVKTATEPLRSQIMGLKKQVRLQKEQIAKLSKATPVPAPTVETAVSDEEPKVKIRMTSARFKKIRAKLGVTQMQMAKLLETSHSSVVNWENNVAIPRQPMRETIVAVSKLGKRELQKRLEGASELKEQIAAVD